MKTHLPKNRERTRTMCGRLVTSHVALIGWHEVVDNATCKACQRADDAMQVREYRREQAEAGKDRP